MHKPLELSNVVHDFLFLKFFKSLLEALGATALPFFAWHLMLFSKIL